MDPRILRVAELGPTRTRAVEDARQMQVGVIEECKRVGKDPPPYGLEELIGKGSFGRVYKGKDMKSAATVAVKIINLDESDSANPRSADSYSDFLKEVSALKILYESKAKNINHVIEALPVGQSMWMITEYCGGGSVATLMKPSGSKGLQEKWIIPILREVVEGLKWVHQADIIHRDIKCANVLVTEQGDVQLCDFGVAGINETKVDKRSTIVGTPHWMAPELFENNPFYGKEVDIWALGSMIHEIATGLPPNALDYVPMESLGAALRKQTPRLEGADFSAGLKNLASFCFVEDPKMRPTIEVVQKHEYIANTAALYPTSGLRALVGSFKVWESGGGSRKSLFFQHGAQNASSSRFSQDDEWNFSTTEVFDRRVAEEFSASDVFDAYGAAVNDFDEDTARPSRTLARGSRRRPPPEAIGRLPAQPLERIFDPNTMSNYDDNSRAHYGGGVRAPQSDLPLRDNSAQASIRDTQIDLGSHDSETGISSFSDVKTLKPHRIQDQGIDDDQSDFSRPALSDPAETNKNRKTLEWTFPSMAPPASANPEVTRFPSSFDPPRPAVTPGSGGRPALYHHPTEPLGAFGGGLVVDIPSQPDRRSMNSLIDLDMSVPDPIGDIGRPSTAHSDVGSTTSEGYTSANPFQFERHASIYQPSAIREPSIYVSEDNQPIQRLLGTLVINEMSDFSASDVETSQDYGNLKRPQQPYEVTDQDGEDSEEDDRDSEVGNSEDSEDEEEDHDEDDDYEDEKTGLSKHGQRNDPNYRSTVPQHPARSVLTGRVTATQLRAELNRILHGMRDEMTTFKESYDSATHTPPVRGSSLRRDDNSEGSMDRIIATTSAPGIGRGSSRGFNGVMGSDGSAGPGTSSISSRSGRGLARPAE